jgi:hypothetical protein
MFDLQKIEFAFCEHINGCNANSTADRNLLGGFSVDFLDPNNIFASFA